MRSQIILVLGILLFTSAPLYAQATQPSSGPAIEPLKMDLWDGDPPNFVAKAAPEKDDGTGRIWSVSRPGMLIYLPEKSELPATAIIACPGGGYTHLTRLVGADGAVAAFVPKGIAVISLKYRLRPPSVDVEADTLLDAKRAVRIVRAHANEWGIDPHKIGLLGWSAGANLGLNLASHFDDGNASDADPVEKESSRPDFVALMSPWPDKNEISKYPIGKNAPPAFIGTAKDDHTAPPAFAQAIDAAYETAGAPHNFWMVDVGGHGAYTIDNPTEGGKWVERFIPWLEKIGMYSR